MLQVTQFHYTSWPDHSVPLYPSSLAKFIRTVNSVSDGDAPTVVHCRWVQGMCPARALVAVATH